MKNPVPNNQFAQRSILFVFVMSSIGCSSTTPTLRTTTAEPPMTIETESALKETDHVYLAGLVIFPGTKPTVLKHLGQDTIPHWTPSTNVVVEALDRLPNYLLSAREERLAHPSYNEHLMTAKENLPESICQVVGITFGGLKGILLNFIPAEPSNIFNQDWQQQYIKVHDRGPRWWSIMYLVDEKQFSHLHFDLGY